MKTNFQNRIFPLFLVVLIFPSFLIIPAHADDSNLLGWYDVLDYGGINGTDSHTINVYNTPDVVFPNPFDSPIQYIDVILYCEGSFDGVFFWNGEAGINLTVISFGDGYYRVYGSVPDRVYSNIGLLIQNPSPGTIMNFIEVRVSHIPYARYPKSYTGYVYDFSYTPTKETYFSGDGHTPMSAVTIQPDTGGSVLPIGHSAKIDIYQWNSMDFLNVTIASWASNIESVTVEIAGFPVPYTINTIQNANVQGVVLYLLDILVDLRNVNRELTSPVTIDVTGQVNRGNAGSFVVQSCYGLFGVEPPSSEVFWFTKLIDSIGTGFSSVGSWFINQTDSIGSWFGQQITAVQTWGNNIVTSVSTWGENIYYSMDAWFRVIGSTITLSADSIVSSITTWGQNIVDALNPNADSDEFRDEVENIRDQMQGANDAMNELDRPPVDDVISGVDIDIGAGSPFSDIMGFFFTNDFIVSIITGSLAFTVFGLLVG